jgi:hypothetical protein
MHARCQDVTSKFISEGSESRTLASLLAADLLLLMETARLFWIPLCTLPRPELLFSTKLIILDVMYLITLCIYIK